VAIFSLPSFAIGLRIVGLQRAPVRTCVGNARWLRRLGERARSGAAVDARQIHGEAIA
jgi:hypothetical protein